MNYDTPRRFQLVLNQLHAGVCPRLSEMGNFAYATGGVADCPKCGCKTNTVEHFLYDCPSLDGERQLLLKPVGVDLGTIFNVKRRPQLLAFVQAAMFGWDICDGENSDANSEVDDSSVSFASTDDDDDEWVRVILEGVGVC